MLKCVQTASYIVNNRVLFFIRIVDARTIFDYTGM